jgi:hypothetical protein
LHLPPSIEDERDPAEEPDRAGALASVSIADDQAFYGRLRVCICVLVPLFLCLFVREFDMHACHTCTHMHVRESDLQRKSLWCVCVCVCLCLCLCLCGVCVRVCVLCDASNY